MDSILRAFGRTSKVVEKKEVKEVEKNVVSQKMDSMNMSEDDIFSDLVVSAPTDLNSISYHHLHEMVDLDLTTLESQKGSDVNEYDDTAPSVFTFMNEDDQVESHDSQLDGVERCELQTSNEGDMGTSPISDGISISGELRSDGIACRENDSPSKFSFIRQDSTEKLSVKISENTQCSSKPKNAKKKKRSVKPGFGNIDQVSANKSSSGASPASSTSAELGSSYGKEDHEEVHKIEVVSEPQPDDVNQCESIEKSITYEDHDLQNENENVELENEDVNQIRDTQDILTSICKSLDDDIKDVRTDPDKSQNSDYLSTSSSCNKDENEIHRSCATIDKENISNDDIMQKMSSESKLPHIPCLPIETAVEDSSVIEGNDIDVKMNEVSVELNEEDCHMLKLDSLSYQEEVLRSGKSTLFERQKDMIDQWRNDHPGEASICLKINELRKLQTKLESEEDYDEAANVNQNIIDLMYQCDNYKYQYPLIDDKFLSLLQEYRDLRSQHKSEYENILLEYEILLKWFKERDGLNEIDAEKKLNEMNLLLTEKKLEVERDIRHTSLDKEHLVKNEGVLHKEIEKQTKKFNMEKVDLLEKRASVQTNIAELIAQLNVLQEEEKDLTTAVTDIESKIDTIMQDFHPRIDEISKLKERTDEQGSALARKMDELIAEEVDINFRKEEILQQRTRNQELVDKIICNIEKIQDLSESFEGEMISGDLLDFEGLEFVADSELVKSKEYLKRLKIKLEDLSKQVLCDEAEEKRLQRSMNDLEAQLSELQKLKQIHVKERKYKDAKLTSDEIKSLTSKGEEISGDAMKLNESIKIKKSEILELADESAKEQEKLDEREFAHDQFILEKLKKMNIVIEKMLDSQPDSWTAGILELQLSNNLNIVRDLSSKHGLVSDKGVEEEVLDMVGVERQLTELEDALQVAVDEENWKRAEEINAIIEEKKKLVECT